MMPTYNIEFDKVLLGCLLESSLGGVMVCVNVQAPVGDDDVDVVEDFTAEPLWFVEEAC